MDRDESEVSEVSDLSDLSAMMLELPEGIDAAELHGLVCGLACGDHVGDMDARLRTLFDLLGEERLEGLAEPDAGLQIDSPLTRFVALAEEELADPQWRFAPLVPDEEASLVRRLDALVEWCSGFLSGFGAVSDEEGLTPEQTEALTDIAQITEVDPQVSEDDDNEADLMQVMEHVKACVLLLRREGDDQADDPAGAGQE